MYFAVIGDILSNFSGLKTILDRLEMEGIRRVYHTGNICAAGQNPGACITMLEACRVICVQGHLDKKCVKEIRRARYGEERHVATTPFGSDTIEYLNTLPRKRILTEESLRILVCHGAVNSGNLILDRATSRAVFQRQRESAPADIILSGGANEPFSCLVDGVLFVMPGTMAASGGGLRYTLVDTEILPPAARTVTL